MPIEKCDVFSAKENPLLIELENLLLGRTDQDLYDQRQEESKSNSSAESHYGRFTANRKECTGP